MSSWRLSVHPCWPLSQGRSFLLHDLFLVAEANCAPGPSKVSSNHLSIPGKRRSAFPHLAT